MRRNLIAAFLILSAVLVLRAAQHPSRPAESAAPAEAIRLNNLGVASMNQQKFEQGLQWFEKAAAADPALAVARVNQAIALINLQRYEPARELLTAVTASDPQNARAWYNLGLLHKSTGDAEASLASFEKTVALRPGDAHSRYFVGLMAAQIQQYDAAVAAFTRALEIDPFLVSAEFGLARAFQRAGRGEEAKSHLERFQRLTTEKIASAMSLGYGDQGPLSLAEALVPKAGTAPPAIAVKFVEAAGLLPLPTSGGAGNGFGAGGCLFDADGDGADDYLALNAEAEPAKADDRIGLFRGAADGTFVRVPQSGLTMSSRPIGCAAADYDNDEKPDVAISASGGVGLFHNEGGGRFADVTAKSGLPEPHVASTGAAALGLTWVDFDHDNDVDLIVPVGDPGLLSAEAAGATPPVPAKKGSDAAAHSLVWRNNGNNSFTEVSAERGLGGPGADIAAVGTDFNNDRAIDLVVTGGVRPSVWINPREGPFKALDWPPAAASPTVGVAVFDFDKDGWMDLAFTHTGAPGLSVWRNVEGKRVDPVALPGLTIARGWGLAPIDYDNDGWVDLVAAGGAAGNAGLTVLRNEQGRFTDATAATAAATLALKNARSVLAGDLDADGDTDLIVTRAGAAPAVVHNEGGNANHALRLTLKGLNDNRSGVGTKVEVQAGASWQKWETVAASGFLGQSAPEVLAGLGAATQADVVRLLWPSGVVQDEVELAAAKPQAIEQIDRRGSSCPIVFTWNGTAYEFITDGIGPGVVGHWVAPGERNVPDPDEYIKVAGTQLRPRNGRLSIKFAEPMEEVIYLDQARLFAIDHPAGSEIYPHEYFAALAPQPPAEVFVTTGTRLPRGAWDDTGRDVLPLLRQRDARYVEGFGRAAFKGFAALHALELDLGELPGNGPLRLIMGGFTDYFTATSVFAAHQAGVTAIVPYLEALLPDGTWKKVSDDIGFPAGLRRTMTADLTGKLPPGTQRIRIWTNLNVYWDQVLIDTTPAGAVPSARHEAPLMEAALSYRGFPREVTGTPAADLTYVYDQVSQYGPYARHRGFYTRYGDVRPLLASVDDRFSIFGAGDEVSLEFDAEALPTLRPGWTRDYLLFIQGYVKDMDFYAAHAQTVTPLPFRDMRTYPYPATTRYPEGNRDYLLDWNTREVGTEGWPTYRFDFRTR
jgi:Tfp pilus assembly protein PilF